jgi:hypothetical protein
MKSRALQDHKLSMILQDHRQAKDPILFHIHLKILFGWLYVIIMTVLCNCHQILSLICRIKALERIHFIILLYAYQVVIHITQYQMNNNKAGLSMTCESLTHMENREFEKRLTIHP